MAELMALGDRYTAECMRDLGFEYDPPPAALDESFGFVAQEQMDVNEVGYGIVAQRLRALDQTSGGGASGEQLGAGDRGPAFLEALYGSADFPGCERAARARVEAERQSDVEAVSNFSESRTVQLDEEVNDRLLASPEFVGLDRAWSECMSAAGFGALSHPVDAVAAVMSRLAAAPPDADAVELEAVLRFEISLAVADEACRVELDYDEQVTALIEALTAEG